MGPSASISSYSVFSGKFMCNTGVPGDARTRSLLSRSVGFQMHGEPEPYQTIFFVKAFFQLLSLTLVRKKSDFSLCTASPAPLKQNRPDFV